MPTNTISPNMGLTLPTPGQEPGPQYATDQNQDLTIIDGHNHAFGSGVQITPAGMNISTNLNFLNNSPYNVYSVIFSAPATNAGLTTLYTAPQSGGGISDLFYNDGAGNVIALTKAGLVNATIASIPGESYSGGTFTWVQGATSTTPANFDIGSIVIRPNTAGTTNGVILGPPTAITSEYNVQLPLVPVAPSFLTINTSGDILANTPVSGIGLNPSGSIIMFGGTAAPTGYLLCDGSSYLQSSFPSLFAAIGTAYGSADGTHFNVPDFRGIFPRGVDNGAGNDPDTLTRTAANTGGNTGDNVGSTQTSAFEQHVHQLLPSGNTAAILNGSGGDGYVGSTGGVNFIADTFNAVSGTISTAETRPINTYVNFIIKT